MEVRLNAISRIAERLLFASELTVLVEPLLPRAIINNWHFSISFNVTVNEEPIATSPMLFPIPDWKVPFPSYCQTSRP